MNLTPDLFSLSQLSPILPELILVGGGLILLGVDLVVKGEKGKVVGWGVVLLIGITLGILLLPRGERGVYLWGTVTSDGVGLYFRLIFSLATLISLLMLIPHFPREGEPFLLMLCSLVGMNFVALSGDLVVLMIAIELVSIPSYILAGYRREDARSAEAALKYLLYGAVSSGIFVYGLSFLYGIGGSTRIEILSINLMSSSYFHTPAHWAATLLILAGIGYKVALVPLHFWAPDVYEGSPTPITAFFSVAPKAAGFAALYRLMPALEPLHPQANIELATLLTFAAGITMTWGNLAAIWQESTKRLLAYSSIAHAGYILIGFVALTVLKDPISSRLAVMAVLFYLTVYLFMNLGAFWAVDWVERKVTLNSNPNGRALPEEIHFSGDLFQRDHTANFIGLGWVHPWVAVLFTIFLLSLTGIPPLAGFVGKFYLLAAVIKGKLLIIAIVMVINTVISLYYYARIIRDMFLLQPSGRKWEGEIVGRSQAAVVGLITLIPTLLLGLLFSPLINWITSLINT